MAGTREAGAVLPPARTLQGVQQRPPQSSTSPNHEWRQTEKPRPHTPPVKRNLNSELSCLQPFQSHCSWHASPEPRPSQCRPSHPGSQALLHLRRGLSVELPMNATALNPMAPASTTAVTSAATPGPVTLCLLGNERGQVQEACI